MNTLQTIDEAAWILGSWTGALENDFDLNEHRVALREDLARLTAAFGVITAHVPS